MFSSEKKSAITLAIILLVVYLGGRLAYGGFTYSEEPSPDFESTKEALRSNTFDALAGAHISQIEDLRRFPKLPPLSIPFDSEVARRCISQGKIFADDVGAFEENRRRSEKLIDAERAKAGPVRPLTSYDFETYWSEYSPIVATYYRYKKGRARMPSHHVGEISIDQRKKDYIWSLNFANEAWGKAAGVERLESPSAHAMFYKWRNSTNAARATLVADLAIQGVFVSVRFGDISEHEVPGKIAKLVQAKESLGDKPAPSSPILVWLTGAFVPICDCFHFMLFLALAYLSLLRWSSE